MALESIWGQKLAHSLHILLQIKNKGRFERSVLPLELKTGRATFSMEHKGQVGHAKGQGQNYFSEFLIYKEWYKD